MKNSHSNHILNTFVQKPGNHMVILKQLPCYFQQIMSKSISPLQDPNLSPAVQPGVIGFTITLI